jgi:hypothetical protein
VASGEHEPGDRQERMDEKSGIDYKLSERKRSVVKIKSLGKFFQAEQGLKRGNRQ